MSRRHSLAAVAVLGISLMTAYAFGKGPFTPFSPSNAPTPSTCPGGTCRPTPAIGGSQSPSGTPYASPAYPASTYLEPSQPPRTPPVYPEPLQPATTSSTYQPSPYGLPIPAAPTGPVTVVAASAPATPPAAARRLPDGQWNRELGPLAVTLRSENGTLAGTVVLPLDEARMQVDFVIEYSITADGQLYGIVQSADLAMPNLPADTDFTELLGVTQIATKLIDQPVSMRYRVDGGTLTLKTFHLALPLDPQFLESVDAESMMLLQDLFVGRYKALPAPTAIQATYTH